MRNPPTVTGQCAEVLTLIRQYQPLPSLTITADHAIPEAAARVHDLRGMGFNIVTRIVPDVTFRGRVRHKVAFYSMGVPEWPAPGFVADEEGGDDENRLSVGNRVSRSARPIEAEAIPL